MGRPRKNPIVVDGNEEKIEVKGKLERYTGKEGLKDPVIFVSETKDGRKKVKVKQVFPQYFVQGYRDRTMKLIAVYKKSGKILRKLVRSFKPSNGKKPGDFKFYNYLKEQGIIRE